MESDRAWLEQQMLQELQQMSASRDEREKLLHRDQAEGYRQCLRNLADGEELHQPS